jgi:hypothetical protein
MIVPKYWAEASASERSKGRQVTVRRFGWSDDSQDDARRSAHQRAKEALARALAGEKIRRRERKVAYNGAEGVPIREEIISAHGETIVTRNIYGALCINTPNVLFADIDLDPGAGARLFSVILLPLIVVAVHVAMRASSGALGCVLVGLAVALGVIIATSIKRLFVKSGAAEHFAHRRIRRFVDRHRTWLVHVYRTPAGFRVLATHRTFEPGEKETSAFFKALGTDRIYVRMCRNQQCFRARVSPKPWRIGIDGHIKPRPGIWPINPERLPQRAKWVEEYERKAAAYASCRYLESLGRGTPDPAAEAVRRLHDELSRATSGLPIA